jgi:hypothetical protein
MAPISNHFLESTNGPSLRISGKGTRTIVEHPVFSSITSGTTETPVIVSCLAYLFSSLRLPLGFKITGLSSILTHSLMDKLFPQSPRILRQAGLSPPTPSVVLSFQYRLGHLQLSQNLSQHKPQPLPFENPHCCNHALLSQFHLLMTL